MAASTSHRPRNGTMATCSGTETRFIVFQI
jgi:hypothetical protein